MSDVPIAQHAVLSDCKSAALVTTEGSVDWLCFPRFDHPSIFARILDDSAGHWSIRPTAPAAASRRYLDDTMVLETTFRTTTGMAVLIDALAVGRNTRGHELGANSPSVLIRKVTAIDGDVEFALEYAPRPEYGLVSPLLIAVDGGITAIGGADVLVLSSPVAIDTSDVVARARFTVRDGSSVAFALGHASTSETPPTLWSSDEIDERLDDTITAWRTWSDLHQAYEGPFRELVRNSGRVLYALTYFPTGAICAAATTSLPETPGGVRNWDYRYAWVRDASFTLQALWVAACPDEAHKFFGFITNAAASRPHAGRDFPIMFGIGGERDLSERELWHLAGWRNSAPVRVGNGAWTQRQLDVYGELLDAAYRFPEQLEMLTPETRRLLADLADDAADRWQEKDQGIWEVRGEPRDFLYSKLMCWVALDRAIQLAPQLGAEARVEPWTKTRTEIRDAILVHGWSDRAGAFTQSFDSEDLDACSLMMPIVGFIPANDPRMLATIHAITDRLTDERGLVFRYVADDGLDGEEGTFLLCTFWLAHALALAGELDRARETFEAAIAFVNDVGLLAEEVDPRTGELLGNFPQAFSHIGLVNAAWAIHEAEQHP
jgi:GH15 family glucan-1,4-alpha-glucosidase